jgi:hypothetical protein
VATELSTFERGSLTRAGPLTHDGWDARTTTQGIHEGVGEVNPDVVAAIARLRADDVLSSAQAARLDRVARRRLVSVRLELRMLLYAGVLLLVSGVGALVVEHHADLGPLTIAASLGLAAAACLVWVGLTAPPFSWEEVHAPTVAFDYVLLLGLLLLATDLGYVEAQFTLLGPAWPHHLLVVGVIYLLAAWRWDSRAVLGLGLTTLAAWRGVSVSLTSGSLGAGDGGELRASALALGALYLAAATLAARLERKAHFEPVLANAGLLLVLGALASGALDSSSVRIGWLAALLATAGSVMGVSLGLGRSLYFAEGVLAAYVALVRLLFAVFGDDMRSVPLLLAALLGVGALALVFAAHRRMESR